MDTNLNTCPSLIKAAEWTIDNSQNPASIKPYLQMPESTIIRVALRRWGTLAEAYDSVLRDAGWYHWIDAPEDGDVAVIGGESIVAWNLATHLPRDLIQLLAFRENDEWQICTELGMSPIDWDKSVALVMRIYRCRLS